MDEASFGLMALKIIIGFISLYFVLIITGRVGVSQLTPIHFVFILLLDDFLGHIIYEKNDNIFEYLFAIGLWTLVMLTFQMIMLKFPSIRSFLQGKPLCIISNGQLKRAEIRKARLDVNQVLSLLRKQGIFSMREVEFGLLEPDGTLSVALKPTYKNPTIEDMNLAGTKTVLPITVIIDGKVMNKALNEKGLDEKWLKQKLEQTGHSDVKNIFYAEWEETGGLYVSAK
ncbi:DUF421 domain-containing protein [Pradoshia sp.]